MTQLVPEMGHVVLLEEVEEKPLLKSQARKDVPTTSKEAAQKEILEIFSKNINSKRNKSDQKGSDYKKPRKQGK